MSSIAQPSLALIYDFIERLHEAEALDANAESHNDRVSSHLVLLAELADSVSRSNIAAQQSLQGSRQS